MDARPAFFYNRVMNIIWIIILSVIGFLLLCVLILGIVGYNVIYKRTRHPYCMLNVPDQDFHFPLKVKDRYRDFKMIPFEEIYITNDRGIKLYGELRRNKNREGTPVVILFSHGFQSTGDNDVPLFENFQLKKYDLLSIDHEACGKSEGRHSGFGICESEDIQSWVKKINEIYDHDVKIFLHGVSMGSNSVLLTADKEMENVKGIIADCGYVSTYSIIHYLAKLHLVAFSICLVNSFILRRNIFRHTTRRTLSKAKYPILFFHGKDDTFVPFFMSEKNDRYCSSGHKFIKVKNASHAMSYLTDPENYEKEFNVFIDKHSC